MEEGFKEFVVQRCGAGTKNRHPNKIRQSWGVYDYYKFYRKNKPKAKEYVMPCDIYYKLIRTVNEALVEILFKEGRLELPYRLGAIEINRYEHTVKIEDGKVKTSRKVNWVETLKLWYSDPEASKNKTLIRFDQKEGVMFTYRKAGAVFHNKAFYEFAVNRPLKRRYREYVASNGIESPYLLDPKTNSLSKLYHG